MMKQMTIKKKVTLWYTGIIALILGMVLVFMFYFVDKVGISATEEEVSAAVTGFSAQANRSDSLFALKFLPLHLFQALPYYSVDSAGQW